MVTLTPVSHNPFATSQSKIPAANAIAAAGRNGDTLLAHTTPGDVTIPAEMRNPATDAALKNILGDKFDQFTAGSSANSRNPQTNLIEFEDGGDGDGGDSGGGGSGGGDPGSSGGIGPGDAQGGGPEGSDPPGVGSDSPAPGAPASAGIGPGIGGSGVNGPSGNNDGTPSTGTESETAVNDAHDPAVSDTVSNTGLSGLVNDVTNNLQSKLSAFQNDPFGVTAAVLGNIALGVVTGNVTSAVNVGLSLAGKPSLGEMAVGLVEGAMSSTTSTSAPADATTVGGLSLGGSGAPGGSPGDNSSGNNEDDENALLSKFYQSLLPSPINSGNKGSSVIDVGQLVGLPDQSPSVGTNTKQFL